MTTARHLWEGARNKALRIAGALSVLLLGLAAIVTSGWVGDGLKGECLFKDWGWPGQCEGGTPTILLRVLSVAVLFVLASWLTYRQAKDWVPVRHIAQHSKVRPHRALIVPVSLFNPLPEQDADKMWWVRERDQKTKEVKREIRLTGDLAADIATFTKQDWRWNGQQFLRCLAPHLLAAQRPPDGPAVPLDLVLIGSSGPRGSHPSLEALRNLLPLYGPVSFSTPGSSGEAIDFERIGELQQLFDDCIRHFLAKGIPESEILIDATGGQKTTSIAAALTTLRWHQVEFQYVESKDVAGGVDQPEPRVLGFNVVVEARASIGS